MSVIPKSSVGPAKGAVVHVSGGPQQVAMVVETPPAHQQVDLSLVAARPLVFNFDPSTVHPQVVEGNLVLDFPNGGAVVLHNSQSAAQNGATMVTLPDGTVVPFAVFLRHLPNVESTAGTSVPTHSSGGVPQAFELGLLGSGFTPVGGLVMGEQNHSAVFGGEQRLPFVPDAALATSATVIDGEDPSVTSTLRSTESITVTGLSGAGGTATGSNGFLTITDPLGTLVVNQQNGTFTFTLNENSPSVQHLPDGTTTDPFTFTVQDSSGHGGGSAPLTIVINEPAQSVSATASTGTVVDASAPSTSGTITVASSQPEAITVSGVSGGSGTAALNGSAFTITDNFGTLVVNQQTGAYTFALNEASATVETLAKGSWMRRR